MSEPCANCKHGRITLHSNGPDGGDRCLHSNNTLGYPPYAMRHDAALCGPDGTWFEAKPAPAAVYKAKP